MGREEVRRRVKERARRQGATCSRRAARREARRVHARARVPLRCLRAWPLFACARRARRPLRAARAAHRHRQAAGGSACCSAVGPRNAAHAHREHAWCCKAEQHRSLGLAVLLPLHEAAAACERRSCDCAPSARRRLADAAGRCCASTVEAAWEQLVSRAARGADEGQEGVETAPCGGRGQSSQRSAKLPYALQRCALRRRSHSLLRWPLPLRTQLTIECGRLERNASARPWSAGKIRGRPAFGRTTHACVLAPLLAPTPATSPAAWPLGRAVGTICCSR